MYLSMIYIILFLFLKENQKKKWLIKYLSGAMVYRYYRDTSVYSDYLLKRKNNK